MRKIRVIVHYNRSLRNYLELIWEFFINDFKIRYKKSLLGVLWAVIRPLLQFYVLYNIWTYFGHAKPGHAYYILAGIMVYNIFSETLVYSMSALLNKSHIILKIYFPREAVVFGASLVAQINFFFNMLVLLGLLVLSGNSVMNAVSFVVHVFAAGEVAYFGALGLGVWLSIWYVRFRDLNHLVQLFLYLLFWLIPVMYPLDLIKNSQLFPVVVHNPLTWVVLFFKDGLTSGHYHWVLLARALLVFVVIFMLGMLSFKRRIAYVAEYY